ncbi:uncharacterized protein Tco025E_01666 [Trypanosoma conorhini]|uniref:Uncharacterized protein n=1 Tax=Trypanosoma conorhini TaxID=83891 RepID=A0A3R7M461_9TRYP|nr:uncharacterized protein Tco025E_01666 [Trypanosoma conorhini]RNF26202.1 hypothetical protein Tco025E_01666 [Trypanosoma conorhini]
MRSVYRDPVSQLAIVPLEAVGLEARDAFRALLPPPPYFAAAGGAIPVILYYAPVTRRTRLGRSLPCHLLLSRSHWYLCKPTGKVSRCCRVDRIAKVILCRDAYVVWKMLRGRDVVLRLGDADEVAFVTNLLRILRLSATGCALPVLEKHAEQYTSLAGVEKPQLERTGHEEGVWPLPLVSAAEAERQCSAENVLLLLPPPPLSRPQAHLELDAGPTRRNARVEAVLRYMDGHVASPRVPASPDAEPWEAAAAASAVPSQRAPSTAASTIRRILPVAESEPVETRPTSPSPHDSLVGPTHASAKCRPPPPPPLMPPHRLHLLGAAGGEPLGTLRKLREVEDRVTSLERENESLRRSWAHSPQPPLCENAGSFRTPSPLPGNPFPRLTPPLRLPSQKENGRAGAAEFERRIAAKPLAERLEIRRHEIDRNLQRVSSYIEAADAEHLTLVTCLQEDLLLLLQAQQAEEELGEAQRRAETHGMDIARPKDQSARRGMLDAEDEAEEEGDFGLDDYDVWAATDDGKEWYNDLFGEHLTACKVTMVRNAFTRLTTSM